MNKLFNKIAVAFVGIAMAVGVGVASGENKLSNAVDAAEGTAVKQVSSIESGKWYYLACTLSTTDYYFCAVGGIDIGTSHGQNGTSVTSRNSATKIQFIDAGDDGWSLRLVNAYYLYFDSATSNGSYGVSSSPAYFTITNRDATSISLVNNNKNFSRNSTAGTTRFGAYGFASNNWLYETTAPTIDVTGLTLNKNATTIEVGDKEQLTATVTPVNATNTDVIWSVSGDPDISVVDGLVSVASTASNGDTATVTATSDSDNTKTASCIVTVKAPVPSVNITNDDQGVISGKIGDDFVVGINKKNDDGLTLEWVLSDDDEIVTFTENTKNIHFNKVGANATLTVQLKDGNEVKAEDSVTLQTLVPSIAIQEGGSDISKKAIYVSDSGTLTATTTNAPTGSTVVWSVNNSNMTVNNGAYEAASAGSSIITASLMYDEISVATNSVSFTVSALLEPTLVLKYDDSTNARTFTYGQSLDMSKISLRYTSNKGVITDVDNPTLNFTSLDYIGTKVLTASYNNMTSNGISMKVTNDGASFSFDEVNIRNNPVDYDDEAFYPGNMPDSWTTNATNTYAAQNAPYRLKLDSNGKIIECKGFSTRATQINVELYVKAFSSNKSSTFTLCALDEKGDPITAINTSNTSGSSTAQNATSTLTGSISNSSGLLVSGVRFTFNLNGNLGVAGGHVYCDASKDSAKITSQAEAYKEYLATFKTCVSGWTQRSDIVTLVNEYNFMHDDAKREFASMTLDDYDWTKPGEYDLSTHEYGGSAPSKSDVNALIKLQAIVDNYNATKTGQETDLSLITPSANPQGAMKVDSTLSNSGATLIITVASVISLAAIGGYFFIRKKKHI